MLIQEILHFFPLLKGRWLFEDKGILFHAQPGYFFSGDLFADGTGMVLQWLQATVIFSSPVGLFIMILVFWESVGIIFFVLAVLAWGLYNWISLLRENIRSERILNYFATSLYGQNTVDDIFWDIAKNCISQLDFEDCVIYQYDGQRKILVQKAAYGPKNPEKHEILNAIEIPLGKGIVGSVAQSGRPEIVSDVTKDSRYILDDRQRFSEVTVPLFVEGKLFGIIDSEHQRKGFFNKRHLAILEKIAFLCSVKISKHLVEEKLRAKIARDLHDEMGSTLTSINILSKIALQQAAGNPEAVGNLEKINEYSGKMMESMSDIIWAINPSNDTLEKIIVRMKEFAAELLEPSRINYYFHETGRLEDVKLNLEQRKDFYLIYKEALNNIVKYSGATEVHVLLNSESGSVQMEITDNGKGFDAGNSFSGNGLKNMRSRAEQMQAAFQLHSKENIGTTVLVELKE